MKRIGPPSRGGPGADRKEVAEHNTRSDSGHASSSVASLRASAISATTSTTREIILRLVVDREHKVEFWLHVTPDGRELNFMRESKDRPSFRVEIIDGDDGTLIEQTKVYDAHVLDGTSLKVIWPIPRGQGWRYHGDFGDGTSSIWRRPHRRRARLG